MDPTHGMKVGRVNKKYGVVPDIPHKMPFGVAGYCRDLYDLGEVGGYCGNCRMSLSTILWIGRLCCWEARASTTCPLPPLAHSLNTILVETGLTTTSTCALLFLSTDQHLNKLRILIVQPCCRHDGLY